MDTVKISFQFPHNLVLSCQGSVPASALFEFLSFYQTPIIPPSKPVFPNSMAANMRILADGATLPEGDSPVSSITIGSAISYEPSVIGKQTILHHASTPPGIFIHDSSEMKMPYSFCFDSAHDVLFVTATGKPTDEEFLDAFNRIVQTPGYHPGAGLLADFTKSESTASTDAIIKSLQLMELYQDKYGNGKWAAVVSNITHYGFGSMFSMLTGKLPVEARVFRKMHHARQWLGLPPSGRMKDEGGRMRDEG